MRTNDHGSRLLRLSLGLFFLATPIESIPVIENFSIVKLAAIIVLAAWVLSGFPKIWNNSVKAFVPFLIYAILSCLWSIDTASSLNAVITFLIPSLFVAMVIGNSITSKKDIAMYLTFYIVGCAISSISSLLTRQTMLQIAEFADQERLTAFGQDQNTLAYLLIMGVVPLLHFINQTHQLILKYLSITLVLLFSYVIVSTGSRTGVIVLVLIFLLFIFSVRKFNILLYTSVLAVFGIPILIQYIPESIIDRLMQTSDLVDEGDFSNRGVIWASALQTFQEENMIFGVGYSNFSTMLKQHLGWQIASHNTYLTYLIEFGIVGVWVFVYLLIKLLHIVRCIHKQEKSTFVYCYILPLFVFMTTLETEYKRWVFILYVLLCAWHKLNRVNELKKK